MKPISAAQLAALEKAKTQYGNGCAAKVEKLLASLRGRRFAGPEQLIHTHDLLLFLRAFPQSCQVTKLADELLAAIASQVTRLRDSEADLAMFDSEQFSGIAGTVIRDTFTYEVARWLARRYPHRIGVEWDIDEQSRQMSSALPQLLPLLADDCLVEADTPYLKWLSEAAGGEDRILPWLLARLEGAPLSMLQKTAFYDALRIEIAWELGDSPASRTCARRNPREFYCHRTPLVRRNEVSLADELNAPPLPLRKLSSREGSDLLHQVREALTVRYRELYGTTRGDPDHVLECDAGRGVRIFLWGLPPDRRLPLRAYLAGITFKNGVPINYIEGIGLGKWMEVGFNTFYAFREGETAWIYAKVLHLLHQVSGATCFSVYPYQLGQDNEEAIKSGAFWFYRKLGFRPGKPELLAITEREERKIASTPGYRTPARTLRKLAGEHVFYEFGDEARGQWDSFATRNIGFAAERNMAKNFAGDPIAMRQHATAWLAKALAADVTRWGALEQSAFADFAALLALAPELAGWSTAEKQAAAKIIRAKTGAEEMDFLRLLQGHAPMKQVLLRRGSAAM